MAERNPLMPGRGLPRESNALAPDTLADGSPDPNATEGWQQLYRNLTSPTDWRGVGSEYANALLMGSTAPGMRAPGVRGPGFRAYHGSPHSFPAEAVINFADGRAPMSVPLGTQLHPDIVAAIQGGQATVKEHPLGRFRLDAIGTGEGAQAYGHGLYFAEQEGTARSYRDAGPASSAAFDAVNQRLSALAKVMEQDAVPGAYRKFRTPEGSAAATEYDALMDKKAAGLGHMYEVNINADPEHFLHWDKPLSEQHPKVQEAIQSLHPGLPDGVQQLPNGRWAVKSGDNIVGREDGWPTQGDANYVHKILVQDAVRPSSTGQELYKRFSKTGDPAAAAQALQEAGIPGIRYLDGGSRAEGEGTHNLVVFNPETIEILRKYGLAGLGLGGAAAGAAQQSDGSQ